MSEGSRRRRANAWVWVYLALFGDGEEGTDIETETTDQVGESAQKTSEEPDE